MGLRFYNTRTRRLEEFKPQQPPRVTMYVCGPTVYDEPHIGHARSAYVFDVIRRWLAYRGYDVHFVRNVTDVDDKIIQRAQQEGRPPHDVAGQYLDAYHRALEALGIEPLDPKDEPQATQYIDQMTDMIGKLLVNGIAYESAGSVYFSVKHFAAYGRLSNRSTEELLAGTRGEPGEGKRDPLDFALWKQAKPGEPSWTSPWGAGRPGWHVECSAMSTHCLGGPQIDIHGGGLDLIFPHHENEIAQSEAASGKSPFASFWLHHGMLTINNQKMSKSLGNFVTVQDAIARSSSDALKCFFLKAHYRSPVDFTDERLTEARQSLEHFYAVIDRWPESSDASTDAEAAKHVAAFEEAMDDDCNTPRALSVLFDLAAVARASDAPRASACAAAIRRLGRQVFDLFPSAGGLLDETIERQIQARNAARVAGDFAKADRIRKELTAAGVILEDTKERTLWRRKR